MKSSLLESEYRSVLCEELIGSGMSRRVYTSRFDSQWVIKIEEQAKVFQNIIEWETWQRVKSTSMAKWFAPCLDISSCGLMLIQMKTLELRKDEAPAKMPIFLSDFKYSNYGWIKDRIVCHDYGTNLLFDYGMSKRMKKVSWYCASEL